jgi:hypothetical protein
MPDKNLLNRIRVEFLEMPGLRLTPAQVQRLCGIERTQCQRALAALVATKFLCVRPNGTYARLTEGADSGHAHPAMVTTKTDNRSVRAS